MAASLATLRKPGTLPKTLAPPRQQAWEVRDGPPGTLPADNLRMNRTSQKLLEILEDGISDEICLDAAELADSVDLDPGQSLCWLGSANVDGTVWHMFFCESELSEEDEEFVTTCHDDDARLLSYGGPYRTLEQARRSTAAAAKDWIDA